MSNVIGIPTSRVSDLFVRQRLMRQIQQDQLDLYRIEEQLSTGRRINMPSEDPVAAMQVVSLQRLLEQKTQARTNLDTNQSFLSATDSAVSSISDLMAEVRGVALGVIGTTSNDTQREVAATQVFQALQQLVNIGNQSFRSRYLFSGSLTGVSPFEFLADGTVKYLGNDEHLYSYGDVDLLFQTNLTGNEVFGAISSAVTGTADCDPILTFDTKLADLRGGAGVKLGSIEISSGSASSIIDISGAETIGDVAAMIHANPPEGSVVTVEVTARGLEIRLDSGNLSIKEVGGGTTARQLGILTKNGAGPGPVIGEDLDPILRSSTRLADLFGVRANAVVRSAGADNDFIVEADRNGETRDAVTLNGVAVSMFDDGTVLAAGDEVATYDAGTNTLRVNIRTGYTQAWNVVDAINDIYDPEDPAGSCFTARLDPLDATNGGLGLVDVSASATTRYGSGFDFDQESGLQVVNGSEACTITFSKDDGIETVEQMLNAINGSEGNVLASINESQTGINICSRVSGADFAIGENGGSTAAELGLRSFTEETSLQEMNFGRGVNDDPDGPDFTITRNDGVTFEIDITGKETIGDVLYLINNNVDNLASGVPVVARLAAYGNGIELVDNSPSGGTLTVTRTKTSTAAIDLGLIPSGQESATTTQSGSVASARMQSAAPDSGLMVQALGIGTQTNGVTVVFADMNGAGGPGSLSYEYSEADRELTFWIDPGATTANDVIGLFNQDPPLDPAARSLFSIDLDHTGGIENDGTGMVDTTTGTMSGGEPDLLTGQDANLQETEGLFSALVRIYHGLQTSDEFQIERAMELLDGAVENMNFAWAELGARQQGMDALSSRLMDEDVELQSALSTELDADLVETISSLTARQVAYEAALAATAQILQMTLLDYL
jgi:flagellar hook-associated protein 3 FlgL